VSHNVRGNGALQKLGAVPEGVLSKAFPARHMYEEQFLWSLNAIDWHAGQTAKSRFSPKQTREAILRAVESLDTRKWDTRPDADATGEAQRFFLTGQRSGRRCARCGGPMSGEQCDACGA